MFLHHYISHCQQKRRNLHAKPVGPRLLHCQKKTTSEPSGSPI